MAPRMSNQCLVDQYYNDEIELPNVDLTEIINSKVIEGAVKWIQENVQ